MTTTITVRTVGSVEYATVTGTVAGIAAFNTAVNAQIDAGYAVLPNGPQTNGVNISQVLFKGSEESFIAEYPILAVQQASTSGYQTVTVAPSSPGTTITALPADTYDFDITIDGGALQQLSITTVGGETYAALAALMSAQVTGGTVSYSDVRSAFVFKSNSTGATSSVLVAHGTAGSTGGDFFAALATADTVTLTFNTPAKGIKAALTIANDQTINFNPGYRFTVAGSTGNDGVYTVYQSTHFNKGVSYAITAVVTGLQGSFTIAGVHTKEFSTGGSFVIAGSTNNNGTWHVLNVSDNGVNTTITVQEVVLAVADGRISTIDSTYIEVKEALPNSTPDGNIQAYAPSVGP